MEIVSVFKDKKLVEYLTPGCKALIYFRHGLGDILMFHPAYVALKRLYPDVIWGLETHCGQEKLFDEPLKDPDFTFVLHYPCCEEYKASILTKTELCCIAELGIPKEALRADFGSIPVAKKPFISVGFQSSCNHRYNVSLDKAEIIWNAIKKEGFIPFEAMFKHVYHHPRNTKPRFVDNTGRECAADVDRLAGILQCSSAFIGCPSGPYIMARAVGIPCLYIKTVYPSIYYSHGGVTDLAVRDITMETVSAWIRMNVK